MTQKQKVIKRLATLGYVDNYWAIKNGILRLSGIMYLLKPKIKFEGLTGLALKKHRRFHKNYYYIAK